MRGVTSSVCRLAGCSFCWLPVPPNAALRPTNRDQHWQIWQNEYECAWRTHRNAVPSDHAAVLDGRMSIWTTKRTIFGLLLFGTLAACVFAPVWGFMTAISLPAFLEPVRAAHPRTIVW